MKILDDNQTALQQADATQPVRALGSGATWTEVAQGVDGLSDVNIGERWHTYDFHSEILPDDRRVIVCLPEAYLQDRERRFPVLYLHDGQNLFDGKTSFVAGRTWRAHTTADALSAEGSVEPLIMVGIYNTGLRRMAEYTPTADAKLGGGEGDRYGRVLVEEVKPFIDSRFRARTGRLDTAVGGSSLGGLISLYLGLRYPEIYGKVAALSPSIWWDRRSILSLVREAKPQPEIQIWLDMGTAEGSIHLRDADVLHTLLLRRGWREGLDLMYLRVEGAVHDEEAWASRFDKVLRFLFPAHGPSELEQIAKTVDFRDT